MNFTHTHTHTHTHTNKYTHLHARSQTHLQPQTLTPTCTRASKHAYTKQSIEVRTLHEETNDKVRIRIDRTV